jgi:hypothetical protein
MNDFTEANILDALKKGQCVASNGPLVIARLNGKSIGETAKFCTGTNTLMVAATSNDTAYGTLSKVEVYVNGNLSTTITLSGKTELKYIPVSLTSTSKNIFVMVNTTSGYRAITNPIWLSSASCESESIPLVRGQNLASFTKWPRNLTPESVLSSIKGNYSIAWQYDSSETDPSKQWKSYMPDYPTQSTLLELNPKNGFWININTTSATLTNTGIAQTSEDIPMYAGQNMVGYPTNTIRTVDNALATIRGNYSIVWQYNATNTTNPWKSYMPNYPTQSNLQKMHPKYGYWINLNTTQETLTITA